MIDVTLAIANELSRIVPDAVIYRENQEQGFEEPSFYIYEIMADSKGELMAYESRKHLYCVMWFPDRSVDDPGVKEQCEKMRIKLLDEFRRLDDLSVGLLDREARIESQALHFTFTLRYRVAPVDDTPKIEAFEQRGGVK
ncbi:hypothetical protein P0G38_06900 [Enterococcus casseliflavus]|uniref:phage tail terminator family protein n=1 Tax=Enterococcus casseliflavus TaxID=37734 RepID=UPI0023D9EEF0|nr:hypothetical protein [Enterococcus casseliflavus]WEL48782.1 hypothetical protein P0G38_06900 [Enterococcus casseliflavus]